jgi:hypothetical protein
MTPIPSPGASDTRPYNSGICGRFLGLIEGLLHSKTSSFLPSYSVNPCSVNTFFGSFR